MRTRRFLLCLLTISLAAPLGAQRRHSHSININRLGFRGNDICEDQLMISEDGEPGIYAEETRSLANQPLNVTASKNGGVSVTDWDQPQFSIKLCKAAAGENAKELLSQISLSVDGGRISVNGPEFQSDWSASILIKAPAGAKLELHAKNGGISLFKTNATVTAHAVNGGIALAHVHGTVDAEARNGGISVDDSGGNVIARVENGGISLRLGSSWDGGKLVASSENGGINVELPGDFRSSLELAGSGHSYMECHAQACDHGQRTWDDEHRYFRIGSGEPVVKASTENGSVEVSDVTAEDDL